MIDNLIRIENLVFEYTIDDEGKSEKVLKGISLDIERGSFTSILGENGSGKSTLAKNLNGLLLPTGGAVYVKGWDTKDASHIWDVRQTAGMVFQNPDNQLVSSIVEDDVAFGPENIGVDPLEIRERVEEALSSVRMGDYRNKAPHLLSGGQKQRIAIAGTIAMKPECIIFDEPTAMLDPRGRKEVMEVIKRLHKDGMTIILITHFMEEAVEGDRIIILNQGEVLMDGAPGEVFSRIDEVREARLDIPMAIEISEHLRKNGIDVPMNVVTEDDLEEFILSWESK